MRLTVEHNVMKIRLPRGTIVSNESFDNRLRQGAGNEDLCRCSYRTFSTQHIALA